MRPTMATVISPRPWEPRLVAAIAESGLVRLTGRCYDPQDVPAVDALVVGSETPWLDPQVIDGLRRRGIAILGVYPPGDGPAIEMFCDASVDQLFSDTTDPLVILRSIRDLAARPPQRGTWGGSRDARHTRL